MVSFSLALADGWTEAATFPHALPESFPLLRSHVLGAGETATSKSAEEDPAQRQNSKGLPEGNLAPAEDRRPALRFVRAGSQPLDLLGKLRHQFGELRPL